MFNIKQFVNKITDNRNDRDRSGETSAAFVESEEQHSAEGFLCPPCMKAFPSAEALEEHYNKTHAFDDATPTDSNSQSNGELQMLRQEVQSLQFSLADEKANSEDLKKEMLRLQADLNAKEMDATSLRSQEREFEDTKSFMTSEVTLLRQQLADSLEQISILRKEKDAVSKNADVCSSDNETLKKEIVSLQTQLSHRNSIDDTEVLRLELVRVQKMMDEMALEKDQAIEAVMHQLNEQQSQSSTEEIEGKLKKALDEIQELNESKNCAEQERNDLVNKHKDEIDKKSSKVSQLEELVSSNDKKIEILQRDCDHLKEENGRLREQHAELCRNIETGEGAKAALESLQKENDSIKKQLSSSRDECTELGKVQHKLKSEQKSLQENLDAKIKELTALKTQHDSQMSAKNEEIEKGKRLVAEKLELLQTKENELSTLKTEKAAYLKEKTALNESLKISLEKEKSLLQKISNQEEKTRSLNTENTELKEKLKGLEVSKSELEETIKAKNEEITRARKSLDTAQASINELQESLSSSKNELEQTKENYKNEIANLEANILRETTALQQKTKEVEDVKQSKEEESTNLKNKIDSVESELNEKNTELEKASQTVSHLTEQCATTDQKLQLLQSKIDEMIQQKLELEQTCASNEEEKSQLLEKLISYEAEAKTLNVTIEELSRKRDDAMAALQELGRENQSLQIEIAKIQGRKWADDSNVSNCSTCTKEFTLTIRKHHCRHCGQIFCNDCSSKSASVPSSKKPVRVCEGCYVKLTTQ